MNPLFFLTRLEPTDDALAAKASALGFTVLRVTLFATEPGRDTPGFSRRLSNLAKGTAIAWTSRRAAEVLVRINPGALRCLSAMPLYAVGEESAMPARRVGLDPRTPAESAGAAGLAQFILSRASEDGVRTVIVLRGDRSLADLPEGLQAGGIGVLPVEVYRTRFLNADVDGLTAWLDKGGPVAAAFFSPSGVTALERLLTDPARVLLHERAAAIARGHTTAGALDARGYRHVFRPRGGANDFEAAAHDALVATSQGVP